MIEYYDTWAIFDLTSIIISYIIGSYTYFYIMKLKKGLIKIDNSKDSETLNYNFEKISNPFLVCLTIPMLSFFGVGLYFLIPTLLYCLTVWYWQRVDKL